MKISRSYILFFSLLFVACIPLFPFFHAGLPITHDGRDHVARIANFYQSLSEGNIIPRWAGSLNWGYGYPILMFLYPLPSYMVSSLHFIGFSFIDSTRLIFVLGFLASGFTMYLWVSNFLGRGPGIFAAFLYMFAPYRFVDLYVRGSLGEHVAFVFLPIVLYFILKLSKNNNFYSLIFGSFFFALFILSHNAINIMFIPFIIAYMVFLFFITKHKKKLITSYILFFGLGLGISAFFWVPAYFEGKYTHRDILTVGRYAESFSSFFRFISSPWSFEGTGKVSVEVGKMQWIVMFGSLPITFFLFIRKKRSFGILLILLISTFWFSLFLMTSSSSFIWEKITILQKFQFPWRLLSLTIFSASVCGAFVVASLPNKMKFSAVVIGIFLLVIFNKDYWSVKDYFNNKDDFFSGIYAGTTDTGESSPRWAVSYMWNAPKEHMSVIGGKASVKDIERSSTKHVYRVNVFTKSQLRENTLYFPGWNITVDKKIVPIEFQDRNNIGIMTFLLPVGEHIVIAQFTDTKLRVFSNILSGITIIFVILFLMVNIFIRYKNYQQQYH